MTQRYNFRHINDGRMTGLVREGGPGQLNTASFGGRQLAPTSIERQSLFSP
jgi:hypothetical protein